MWRGEIRVGELYCSPTARSTCFLLRIRRPDTSLDDSRRPSALPTAGGGLKTGRLER